MICKRCKVIMKSGTTYEQKSNEMKSSAQRFHECKKCKERIYTKEPNFQELLNRTLVKLEPGK